MHNQRFDRNIRLFGSEGQERLRGSRVAIVGIGGLGSHIVQQLALLGVGGIAAIDGEEISTSNRNRYIGAFHDDPIPGTPKVEVARRLAHSIDPSIVFRRVFSTLKTAEALEVLTAATHIFGCVDDDGPRFVLNDIATAYAKPYIDAATDVVGGSFGGRIVSNWNGDGCLFCMDEIDQQAVQRFLESEQDRRNRESVYGISTEFLDETGPAVVSVNGVVASLAVTEFMVACTGMRPARKFLNYDGAVGRVSSRDQVLRPGCPYCGQWGVGAIAEVTRYVERR